MNERVVEEIRLKLLELAIENSAKISLGFNKYGNYFKAMNRENIIQSIIIKGDYPTRWNRNIQSFRPEYNLAEIQLLDKALIETNNPNCSKVVIRATWDGVAKYFSYFGKIERDVEKLTGIDLLQNNRRKLYDKMMWRFGR